MAYRIEYAARAEADVREAVAYIRRDSLDAARRWLASLRERTRVLRDSPEGFPVISEIARFRWEYRAIHHYSHRVIYRIDIENEVVYIVRVYHGARRPLAGGEIE